MAIVQFRVDDKTKEDATVVFEKIGIDLSTAMRMFLKKCIAFNGIPFSLISDEKPYIAKDAAKILDEMSKISEANGNSEMTLDEINEEIYQARKSKNYD